MGKFGLLLVVIAAFAVNLPPLAEQWRRDRRGFVKSLWFMGAYGLYIALGFGLLLLLLPREPSEAKAFFLTPFIVGWIAYGALILMRVVTRYREPPKWLGLADLLLIGLTLGSLTAAEALLG
jgi:biotin transporter BioY